MLRGRTFVIFVLASGCSSESRETTDAGAEPSCVTPSLRKFNGEGECWEAAQDVPGLCAASIEKVPSASLGFMCGFDPEGNLWAMTVRGDIDVLGLGWRFTDHRTGYKPIPAESQATQDQTWLCAFKRCLPACPGTTNTKHFCPWSGDQDAGASDSP